MAKFLHFNHVMSCNSSISKQQGNIGTRLWLPDVDSRMIRLKRILAFSSIICLFSLFWWRRNLIWTLKIAPNWNSWKEFWHFCVFIWLFVLFLCFDEEEQIELGFKIAPNCSGLGSTNRERSRLADRPAFCRQQAVLPGLGCAQPQPHQTDAAQFYLFFCLSFFY